MQRYNKKSTLQRNEWEISDKACFSLASLKKYLGRLHKKCPEVFGKMSRGF